VGRGVGGADGGPLGGRPRRVVLVPPGGGRLRRAALPEALERPAARCAGRGPTARGRRAGGADQITMQTTALTYLLKPEMIKELKLRDDQRKQLKELQTESRKALTELY